MDKTINNKDSFKRTSVSVEIKTIVLKVSFFTLVIAMLAFFIIDIFSVRQQLKDNLNTIAQVTANNSVGAIAFEDTDLAITVLASLDMFPGIEYAALYTKQDKIFQDKSYDSLNFNSLVNTKVKTAYFNNGFIEVITPISYNNEAIGYLFLVSNTNAQSERWLYQLAISLVILVICCSVALYLASRLPRSITSAINNIIGCFSVIAQSRDYSQQVSFTQIKEIDTLVSSFNTMLAELAMQDKELNRSEERLTLALAASEEGMWDWSLTDRSVFYDARVCQITGYNQEDLGGKMSRWKALIHKDDYAAVKASWMSHYKNKSEMLKSEYRIRAKTGEWRWVKVLGKTVEWSSHGRPLRITGTITDCTESRKSEEERALLTTVFKNAQESVAILDNDLTIRSANRAFTGLVKKPIEQIINISLSSLFHAHHNVDFFIDINQQLQLSEHWDGELRFTNDQGELVTTWLEITPVNYNKLKEGKTYIATFSDVLQRKRVEDELRYLANYDTLTGLPNRRLLAERFNHSLALSKRYGFTFAIMFLDLDGFKKINDTLGHTVGDKLLMEVAKRLKTCIRESDTVARMGGDEFVILIEDVDNKRVISKVADKIIDAFQQKFHIIEQDIKATTSIGVAIYPDDGQDMDILFKNSDIAMYEAKKKGRNNFKFYNTAMNDKVAERMRIESYLDTAIENNELRLFYQPKLSLKTLEVVGVEALIRWQHPVLGFVSPVDFINIAEDSGHILAIGEWVIRRACEDLLKWQGSLLQDIDIAVNVSAKQFEQIDLAKLLKSILSEKMIPANKLEIELTESLLMATGPQAIHTLKKLKELGVKLSIDDFGTGYSSLQYLSCFPVDYLKIDRSFLMDIENNQKNETIVRAIIAMAKGLGLKVIAEGIEQETQLVMLQSLGCDLGQGFYFSKPLPHDQFVKYFTQQQTNTSLVNLTAHNRLNINELN
ncbi:EAL domain-containing protein [Colwellia piezophila]|uniref:EAL domain-containing protein n=1 Tax=Colwellia piezophila TaxID=211668 RepID=UPI000373B4A9|nr:EAL domain-containing protein [Colwellia piezophila]